jgi:autotransporter passenger strand-loop-strand repeat protein
MVGSGGYQVDLGTAISSVVTDSGQLVVDQGGVASGTILSGGVLYIFKGSTIGTVISGPASEFVFGSGSTTSTIVGNDGLQQVMEGKPKDEENGFGEAHFTTVESGGEQLDDAAEVYNTTVQSGGLQVVEAEGLTAGAIILTGGRQLVGGKGLGDIQGQPYATAYETTLSGGTEIIQSNGQANNTVISAGYMDLQAGATASGGITFEGTNGTLQIDGTVLPKLATISGFAPGNTIDLTGLSYAAGVADTLQSDNVLQITDGGESYDLYFDPLQDLTQGQFVLLPATSGGIQIKLYAQTTVGNSQQLTVQSGQADAGVTVTQGGALTIASGGTVDGTVVDPGGTENDSGTTSNTTLSGGLENLFSGGVASGTTVSSGGEQSVAKGARALSTHISSGGQQWFTARQRARGFSAAARITRSPAA